MSEATPTRVSGDTRAMPFKVRQPSRRALAIALAVAMILHVPFVPSSLLAWLQLYVMMGGNNEGEDTEGEVIIPIDFDLAREAPATAPESPSASPPVPAPSDPGGTPVASASSEPKPPKKHSDNALDGGVDAALDGLADASFDAHSDAPSDAPPDAPLPDAADPPSGPVAKLGMPDASDGLLPAGGLPDAGKEAIEDAGVDAGDAGAEAGALEVASAADAGAPKVRDPLAKAGGPAQLAKKPNVQILIAGDRIRRHELGTGFSKILKSIPQWSDFFQSSNVDPIRDLDHLLLAGPQFKVDSSKVVAVMDYNKSEKEIRDAVNTIVTSSGGEWIKDAPVPAAQAKADRADRIFAMIPGKRLLVILPVSEKEKLGQLKALPGFSKSSQVGISVALVAPAKPFKGIVKLPESLKEMRLDVTPTSDGGADLLIELDDASTEEATTHAAELTNALELFRLANQIKIPFTSITIDIIDKTTFFADGKVIRTSTHLSVKQLRGIMGFAEQQFQQQKKLLEEAAKNKKKK